jgi:uncharacterized protein
VKQKWIEKEFEYDGTQLASLHNYLQYGIAGDSIVAWIGPCDISFDKMADGEDILSQSEIRGGKMLHFILEKFDVSLYAAVALQRLVTSLAFEILLKNSANAEASSAGVTARDFANIIKRDGDDIFIGDKKLSISVAVPSYRSCLVHFAVNITNENTPVPTVSLTDLGIEPVKFAKDLMDAVVNEDQSIIFATHKVHGVTSYEA